MSDSPSTWIQFEANREGELELVITKEVWEILKDAASGEQAVRVEDDSVRIDLKMLLKGKVVASINGFPPSQNPPCQHTFTVDLAP